MLKVKWGPYLSERQWGTVDIAEEHGRGVVLMKLVRGGEEVPFAPWTVVNRGDLLRVAGSEQDVERAGKALGYVERSSAGPSFVAGLRTTGPGSKLPVLGYTVPYANGNILLTAWGPVIVLLTR